MVAKLFVGLVGALVVLWTIVRIFLLGPCTFPLGSVDLVLGLPWLIKHNPRIDWPTLFYEFIRNGCRYFLWPAKPSPSIRITSPEDFRSFVDKSTSLYLIDRHKVSPPQAPPDSITYTKQTKQ